MNNKSWKEHYSDAQFQFAMTHSLLVLVLKKLDLCYKCCSACSCMWWWFCFNLNLTSVPTNPQSKLEQTCKRHVLLPEIPKRQMALAVPVMNGPNQGEEWVWWIFQLWYKKKVKTGFKFFLDYLKIGNGFRIILMRLTTTILGRWHSCKRLFSVYCIKVYIDWIIYIVYSTNVSNSIPTTLL